MNDDDLSHAMGRLASALTPPADTLARVGARVERRRRRRTTTLAIMSVVAVLGGGGIASAVASGSDSAAPALDHGVAAPVTASDVPALPTQVIPVRPSDPARPLGDDTLTYDPHTGVLASTPALPLLPSADVDPPWLDALRCHGGVDVRRPFAAILDGGAPSIHGAVADQVHLRSDKGLEILKYHRNSAVVFADGPDGKRRVRLEVFHGFGGWVWITRRVCD